MKLVRVLALLTVFVMAIGASAQARQAMGIHAKNVDGFIFLADHSGSMLMSHTGTNVQKIEMAKQAMVRLNAKVPFLAYQAGLSLFSPNSTPVAVAPWKKADFTKAIYAVKNDGQIFGRTTPMAVGFDAAAAEIAKLPAKAAVVLFSDGEENLGGDPVAAAKAWYAAKPGLTVHVVSVADSAAGMANLKAIAALKNGAIFADAREILDTEEAALEFARTAFYSETIPSDEVVSMQNVYFATGSFKLDKRAHATLDELANILVTRPELKLLIEGYADVTGNFDRNITLSQNRSKAVKEYLAGKGCKAEQLILKGRGETDTRSELRNNRRVEIMIITQ